MPGRWEKGCGRRCKVNILGRLRFGCRGCDPDSTPFYKGLTNAAGQSPCQGRIRARKGFSLDRGIVRPMIKVVVVQGKIEPVKQGHRHGERPSLNRPLIMLFIFP